MRCLKKNKQKMFYALYDELRPVYATDEDGNIVYEHYTDSDGNWIYYLDENGEKIPMLTGETQVGYIGPVSFYGNIAMSGGEAEAKEFGLDLSAYDAVLITKKGELPIDETSLLWSDSAVGYRDSPFLRYPSNQLYPDTSTYPFQPDIDPSTADYQVVKVSKSINFTKYILKAIVK